MKQITKEIKDIPYHLYIGCETNYGKMVGVILSSGRAYVEMKDGGIVEGDLYALRLLLRKLSSMTEEEKEKLFDSVFPEGWMTRSINWAGKIDFINYYLNLEAVNNSDLFDQIIRSMDFKHHIKMVNWVRENKFDADELIDSGLALDKESK